MNGNGGFEPRAALATLAGASSANLSTFPYGSAGFEPTTDRLTADSSTTELLRNNMYLYNVSL